MPIDFEQARHAMVEQQVRPWEVLDTRVLDVLTAVKREDFVPSRQRKLAFADVALPIEHGEFMLKPVVEGRLLQSLDLQPEDAVLVIGTGTGFITACIAQLARSVVSIDIHADLAERARGRLDALGLTSVRTAHADALAFDPGRCFDAIAVTGAVDVLPPRFLQWLKPGGRMFVVQGQSPAQEALRLTRRGESTVAQESLFETDIPYLHGAAPTPRFVL